MTERRNSSGALLGLVAALACAGAAQLLVRRGTATNVQRVVRLLDLAQEGAARFEAQWDPPKEREALPALQRWHFEAGMSGWQLTDAAGHLVPPSERENAKWAPRAVASTGTGAPDLLRFPTGQGSLAFIVPCAGGRLLSLRGQLRRASPQGTVPDVSVKLQGVLAAQPLRSMVELGKELATRSLPALMADEQLRIGRGNGEALRFTTDPVAADATLHTSEIAFVTPPHTQALLLLFVAGDGSAAAPLDLQGIELREQTLRTFLDLGGRPPNDEPRPQLAPFDARDLAVLPAADPARAALRRVDDLMERRDALLLPPPASASLELDLPSGPLLLEYGVTRVFEDRRSWGQQPIDVEVRVQETGDGAGDAIVHAERLRAGDPTGWQDRALDLSRLAGRHVRVSFATRSERSFDLVAIGAPLVRRRTESDPRRSVILVSIDTVRADHMSLQGYPRPTTPNLDELARTSAWFRDVSSTSSYTLPAHGSMLTGQLPSRHGAESETPGRDRLFPDRSDLLAVRLRREGWLTAAFTGGAYLRAGFGFDQGFDRYDVCDLALSDRDPRWKTTPKEGDAAFNARHRAGRNWDHALDWIRGHADSRFLLFLHTYLVHDYAPDAPHDARMHGSCASRLAPDDLLFIRDKTRKDAPGPADLDHYVDLYDATLREADDGIGRLVATLREAGLYDDVVLVVTSDHGEEFLDHGGLSHGRSLHEEMVRVPLLLHAPGVAAREIRRPVSLVDLTPTLLDLLGFAPEHEVDGRSLLPLLRGEEDGAAPALQAELWLVPENHVTMRRAGDLKATDTRDETPDEARPLDAPPRAAPRHAIHAPPFDPGETVELADEEGATDLLDELDGQRAQAQSRRAAARREPGEGMTPRERNDLEKTGYPPR